MVLDSRSIPSILVADIKDKPYFHANPFGATAFLRFNVKKKPFDDVRVARRWRSRWTSRTSSRKSPRAGEPVANSISPPGSRGYTAPQGLAYNPAEGAPFAGRGRLSRRQGLPRCDPALCRAREAAQRVATEMQALWKRRHRHHIHSSARAGIQRLSQYPANARF